MNPLLEKFPEKIKIEDTECRINPDFKTVLYCNALIENIPEGEDIPEDILLDMLKTFYPKVHLFKEEHLSKMFWFLSCGREKEKRKFPRKAAGINNNKPFDFKEDADLIYAGFIQQYGIDLQKTDMHWWKFMILLENLGAETRFSKVMEYRTRDISSKKLSKEERQFYAAMQKYFSLENRPRELDERSRKIEDALMRGEDITELLRGDCD